MPKLHPFRRPSNQVFAWALRNGPLPSMAATAPMSLKTAFFGEPGVGINTPYNNALQKAREEGIVRTCDAGYELAEEGHKLLTWAAEENVDLSAVRTEAAKRRGH